MKSLTEQQLRDLLKEAWEDGGATYIDKPWEHWDNPGQPTKETLEDRDKLFTRLIASV